MGIISDDPIGAAKIPYIPSRSERRKRAKKAGVFKHKGAWRQINHAAYEQQHQSIEKIMHREAQKINAMKEPEDEAKN